MDGPWQGSWVLSDQIGIRTRDIYDRSVGWQDGPSGARGPASWWDRSMNRLHDALPSFNLRLISSAEVVYQVTFSNSGLQ